MDGEVGKGGGAAGRNFLSLVCGAAALNPLVGLKFLPQRQPEHCVGYPTFERNSSPYPGMTREADVTQWVKVPIW